MTDPQQRVERAREDRWPKNTCEHCGCHYGYHEVGCVVLLDEIVERVTTGFWEDVKRIMDKGTKNAVR